MFNFYRYMKENATRLGLTPDRRKELKNSLFGKKDGLIHATEKRDHDRKVALIKSNFDFGNDINNRYLESMIHRITNYVAKPGLNPRPKHSLRNNECK